MLDLGQSQITDAGCAYLASRLRSGALPALAYLYLDGVSASDAAIDAVHEARPGLHGWDEEEDDAGEEDEEDEAGEA